MVVMVIISILSLIAIPSFKVVLENQKLNADAKKLATVLRTARSEAILHGKPVIVKFYTRDNSYKVLYPDISGMSDTRYYLSPGIKYIGYTTFPEGADRVNYCLFYSSGAPNQGGTITLGNSTDTKRYIIVNGAAGRVRVSDEPPTNWK
ncbi:MAG: hypothetical protein GX790_02160 [Syntrophomonadaceae bacterium]|nr:hypothetical protein [Syntrophomonadaceae bacterium]